MSTSTQFPTQETHNQYASKYTHSFLPNKYFQRIFINFWRVYFLKISLYIK